MSAGSGAAALLAMAAALVLWSPADARAAARVRRLAGQWAGGTRRTGRPGWPRWPRWTRRSATRPLRPGTGARGRWVLGVGAGLAVALLVGGPAGAVTGLVVGVGAERVLRRYGSPEEGDATALLSALPFGCDLLAVCLAAGVPPRAALAAVATAVPPPLAERLAEVAALYRLGAEPARAWSGVPPELHGLARVLVRAGESGSAVGPALRALAAEARAEGRSRAQARLQRAGVWVLAPLGACFLPAFLCLGVVPLVLGIAGAVFR